MSKVPNTIKALRAEVDRMQALLDEWGISDEPPIKLQAVKLENTVIANNGDLFNLTVYGADGSYTRLTQPITQPLTINRAAIYKFRDALGFKHAMMGVFGEAKK